VESLSKEAVEDTIFNAIRKVKPSLSEAPMSDATRFDSLGLESIERIMVVFEIEEAYGVSIVDQQLDTFRTVGEARDLVLKLAAAAQVR
jgi:acyl carrier protein